MGSPTRTTIKRLFATSGNKCAFPSCISTIIDGETGVVIGEICHIKANSPEGPRYDLEQSDEDRQSFENLILLCPTHHKIIDQRHELFSVEWLKEIKNKHESMFIGEPVNTEDNLLEVLLDRLNKVIPNQINFENSKKLF
jgi:hypothetical protein